MPGQGLEELAGSSSSCPTVQGELRRSPACMARHPVWSWRAQGCLCYALANLLGR